MRLELHRDIFTDYSTTGEIFIDGLKERECFSLEDTDRHLEDGKEKKVFGRTAIPRGTYKVVMDWSPKYGRDMPHLLDVPGFEGIRIHSGNSSDDTEGCILVGTERVDNYIRNSRIAFHALVLKMSYAWSRGEEVLITIT